MKQKKETLKLTDLEKLFLGIGSFISVAIICRVIELIILLIQKTIQ